MITKYDNYIKETFIDNSGSMKYNINNIFFKFYSNYSEVFFKTDDSLKYLSDRYNYEFTDNIKSIKVSNIEAHYILVSIIHYLLLNNETFDIQTVVYNELLSNIIFADIDTINIVKTIDFDFKESSYELLLNNVLTYDASLIKNKIIKKFIEYTKLEDTVKHLIQATDFDLI